MGREIAEGCNHRLNKRRDPKYIIYLYPKINNNLLYIINDKLINNFHIIIIMIMNNQ